MKIPKADTVRFTKVVTEESTPWYLKLFGVKTYVAVETNERFEQTRKLLQKEFIRKIQDNKRFNDIIQKGEFEHHFYKLSPKIKKLLQQDDYFDENRVLYGFEDPVFYKKGKLVGSYISHEQQWAKLSKG